MGLLCIVFEKIGLCLLFELFLFGVLFVAGFFFLSCLHEHAYASKHF